MALYKRGDIWWCSFTTPSGERVRCSAGTSDKRAAQEFFDKLKHESWQRSALKKKERHTWDEACLLWLREKDYKKSIEGDKSCIRALRPYLGKMYLDELTHGKITRVIEEIKARTSAATANRYIALINSILTRAVEIWEWLDRKPAITRYKQRQKRVRYLSSGDIRRVYNELPEHLKDAFMFSIMTGLRRANVINLRWEQIDFQRNVIIIDGSEMKAGQTHVVPISASVRQLLSRNLGKHPRYVFTNTSGGKLGQFWKHWKSALERAGIKDYHWHDNRHTWASVLIQNGVPINEIQEMGGWHSMAMVQRYAHLSPYKLAENTRIIDDFIEPVTILSQ